MQEPMCAGDSALNHTASKQKNYLPYAAKPIKTMRTSNRTARACPHEPGHRVPGHPVLVPTHPVTRCVSHRKHEGAPRGRQIRRVSRSGNTTSEANAEEASQGLAWGGDSGKRTALIHVTCHCYCCRGGVVRPLLTPGASSPEPGQLGTKGTRKGVTPCAVTANPAIWLAVSAINVFQSTPHVLSAMLGTRVLEVLPCNVNALPNRRSACWQTVSGGTRP